MNRHAALPFLLIIALSACDQKKPQTAPDQTVGKPNLPATNVPKTNAVVPEDVEHIVKNLTDERLNALVKRGATQAELIEIYGQPVLKQNISNDGILTSVLGFNFSISSAALKKKGGRVGFTATLNNGKIVAWREIQLQPAR